MGKTLAELDLAPWSPPESKDLMTAHGRFALFIRNLSPLFQRLVVGINLGGWEALDELDMSDAERAELHQAEREFRRHLSAVARELDRWHRRRQESTLHGLVCADFTNLPHVRDRSLFIPRPRRGGARKKALADLADVRLLEEFQQAVLHLRPWFEKHHALRSRVRRDSYQSSPEVIYEALTKQGCDPAEAEDITSAKTLDAAAARLLARFHRSNFRTIQSRVSRARSRLRRAGIPADKSSD